MSTFLLPVLVELGRHLTYATRVGRLLWLLLVLAAVVALANCAGDAGDVEDRDAGASCVTDAGDVDAGETDPRCAPGECFNCGTGACVPGSACSPCP